MKRELLEVSNTYIDIESVATALATSGDHEQAEFINVFFKSLFLNCGKDEFRVNTQLLNIETKLCETAKKYVEVLSWKEGDNEPRN